MASAARHAGHKVSALDLMFSSDPVEETLHRVKEFRPHCLGLSVNNIDNHDMFHSEFYLPPLRALVRALREVTRAPIVLGGAGFSIFPLECLEYLDLEMGVVGEGEWTFPELLRRLENNAVFDSLPGMAIRRDGRTWINPPAIHARLWPFPPPDRELFDVRRYNSLPGVTPAFTANLQARRGCHLRCIYLANPIIEGRAIRTPPPSEVAEELAGLEVGYGIRYAIFIDSLFNYPQDYTLELCREIASRRLSIRWWCTFNPYSSKRTFWKPSGRRDAWV